MPDIDIKSQPEKVQMPERWPEELKALLVLGVPMGLTQLVQFSIYTVDILMIGRLGAEDLAAASLGSVIYFALWMVGFGPIMATAPLISQALGADQNDRRDARKSVRMALWSIAFMFPVLLVLISFSEPLSLALGQDPAVSKKAGYYVWALALGWPFALGTMVLRNFLAAIGKTFIPFWLVTATTGLNILLNYIFIFGNFGAPRLELVGAGIASSLSYMSGFFLFVLYIRLDKMAHSFHVFERFWRPHWERLREIMRLGWPISASTIFEGMLFNAAVIIVGMIGVAEQAAYQVGLNVAALAFMMPFGLAMAGSIRVGLAKGADNIPAVKRSGLVTIALATVAIGLAAIVVALFPKEIAALYIGADMTMGDEVRLLVISFLPIAAAFMLFDAVQVAANQVLRGLKDVNWPMVLTGISYWVIGFPTAVYLGLYTDMEALGVWYGLLAGLVTASILLGTRFYWLVWRRWR